MTKATAKKKFFIECAFTGGLSALISKADAAQEVRDYETVGGVGSFLIDSVSPSCTPGNYFAGVALIGEDVEKAREHLEKAADGIGHYSERATLSLGVIAIYSGDYSRVRQLVDSLRQTESYRVYLGAQMNMAVTNDRERKREDAAAGLESLITHAPPSVAGCALNNLALVYLAQGRVNDAMMAIRIALMNPFARFNPTWLETYQRINREVEARGRVSILVPEIVAPTLAEGYSRIETFLETKPDAATIHAYADGGEAKLRAGKA